MLNKFSPLRYPGGKAKLSEYMISIFCENDLNDGHYVEPYAGGAGVALSLLFMENASHIHINDIDPAIYAFWRSIIHETEAFCRLVHDTEVTPREWASQKNVMKNPRNFSPLELGFSLFFLNRTNRSGIINAGMIGGNRQDGIWKLDARYNKGELIERIERIASFESRISLYNLDACVLVNRIQGKIPDKSLIYFDPPYYMKGDRLYKNHYVDDDHKILGNFIQQKTNKKWITSYDDVPPIREIFQGRRQKTYKISYSARNVYHGSEVIIYSDDLIVPATDDPLNVYD